MMIKCKTNNIFDDVEIQGSLLSQQGYINSCHWL